MITSSLLLIFCLLVLRFSKNLTQETDGVDITVYNEAILLYNKAIKFHTHGDLPTAISLYNSAILVMEVFPEAHQNVALLHDEMGDTESARYHNQRSIEYAPNPSFKATAILNRVNMEYSLLHVKSKESLMELSDLLGKIPLSFQNDRRRKTV